jgi:hypothetical protein
LEVKDAIPAPAQKLDVRGTKQTVDFRVGQAQFPVTLYEHVKTAVPIEHEDTKVVYELSVHPTHWVLRGVSFRKLGIAKCAKRILILFAAMK